VQSEGRKRKYEKGGSAAISECTCSRIAQMAAIGRKGNFFSVQTVSENFGPGSNQTCDKYKK
jgi:hypothetical protein